jgi:hypothetical protein
MLKVALDTLRAGVHSKKVIFENSRVLPTGAQSIPKLDKAQWMITLDEAPNPVRDSCTRNTI